MCVRLCFFRRALRYGVENWHGGRRGTPKLKSIFPSYPNKSQRSYRCQSPLEMLYGYQCDQNPWPDCRALLGSKIMLSTWGQFAQKRSLTPTYVRRTTDLSKKHKLWSKVKQRLSRGIQWPIHARINILLLPNLVERAPDQSLMHFWGQRSYGSHSESTKGQNTKVHKVSLGQFQNINQPKKNFSPEKIIILEGFYVMSY